MPRVDRKEVLTARLWQAAHDYEFQFISGTAVGLVTMGVMQNKPKSLKVADWQAKIWDEYYVRKAAIAAGSSVSFDFSSFGPIPHTVPELKHEVFG